MASDSMDQADGDTTGILFRIGFPIKEMIDLLFSLNHLFNQP